jgi:hypothetical protein
MTPACRQAGNQKLHSSPTAGLIKKKKTAIILKTAGSINQQRGIKDFMLFVQ